MVSLLPPESVKTDPERVLYRCLIQAVANMTVNNPANQLGLITSSRWQDISRKIFLVDDRKCGEYSCMLLSTCFSRSDAVEAFINGSESHASFLIDCLTKLTSVFEDEETEWAVFAVQKSWNANGFARFLREKAVDGHVRSFLYQIFSNMIQKNGEKDETVRESNGDEGDENFSVGLRSNIAALAEVFNVEASEVFSTTSLDAPPVVDVDPASASRHFSELLDVLCIASSSSTLVSELQSSLELVMSVTTILIQIVALSRNSSSSASSSSTPDGRRVFYRDVVRLLGNLCWKHRRNQDAVRDLNGVPALLNSFHIDESSPFVRQWAVFALRNLCEDNLENQEAVAGIQLRGVEDRGGVLEEMGLEIELDGGKPRLRKKD